MKKFLACIITFSMFLLWIPNTVIGNNENKIAENMSDLQIDSLKTAGISDKEISAMQKQIEVNNLSKEKIENYVASKIAATLQLLEEGYAPKNYLKNADGSIVTPWGIVPDLKKPKDLNTFDRETSSSNEAVYNVTDDVDATDQTGVYYLIESTEGYDQMTSYVTLPVIQNAASIDRPYHMFGLSSVNGSEDMWGDIGLVYYPDSSTWKGFYNIKERNETIKNSNYNFNFSGGRNIYFHLTVTTSSAILDIINPSTWSVIRTIKYDFQTNCVPSNFSTVKISKQITLAQHTVGNTLNIYTGTTMTGGQFSQTHLYLTNVYDYSFSPEYCSKAIRKGPTSQACNKISYSNTAWTSETVNISFN